MTSRPGYVWRPTGTPTPREIKALVAVSGGKPLTEAAADLGTAPGSLGGILSILYARLGIKNVPAHRLSHDRRQLAIEIGKRDGWWPGTEDGACQKSA